MDTGIRKARTGIWGLDEITHGGLPAGRPTLLCGGPGCGKTVLAMECLVRGAREFDEPGLFVSFDETPRNLLENFSSLTFGVDALMAAGRLRIDHVDLSSAHLIEAGEFSLEALRLRIEHGIAQVGARRVALDGLESMFAHLTRPDTLRRELARLFHWLRTREVTAVITAEAGQVSGQLTRHGFEEYISDCVLLLDHRISEQISKRRLRIIKYRGSNHGKDEHPFLVDSSGFSVLPVTSPQLEHAAPLTRVATGVAGLDEMLGGRGFFKAATAMVSGRAGTGKSTIAAAFAAAACARGERCQYFSFEESSAQIQRNTRSVGINFDGWIRQGLLQVHATRPSFQGLEEHLAMIIHATAAFKPDCVVIDPISNFISAGAQSEVRAFLMRLVDDLKGHGITLLLTALTEAGNLPEETQLRISSLVDTWVVLDIVPVRHRRHRELHIVKSRGMEHSQDTHELILSTNGVVVRPLESEGVA